MRIGSVLVLLLALSAGGCQGMFSGMEKDFVKPQWYEAVKAMSTAEIRGPRAAGKARIVFTRESSMLGAAVPHCVIDCGTGIRPNAHVIVRNFYPSRTGDFDVRANVLEVTNGKQHFIQPETLGGEFMAAKTVDPEELARRYRGKIRRALIIGEVRSGTTLTWDRFPGTMKLEVFTPGGDHGFARHMQVEAGRTYEVTYSYGFSGVEFSISPAGAD